MEKEFKSRSHLKIIHSIPLPPVSTRFSLSLGRHMGSMPGHKAKNKTVLTLKSISVSAIVAMWRGSGVMLYVFSKLDTIKTLQKFVC